MTVTPTPTPEGGSAAPGENSNKETPAATVDKAAHEAALAAARKEEKDKLYPDLDKARKASEAATKKAEAAEAASAAKDAELATIQAKLKEMEDKGLTEAERQGKESKEAIRKATEAAQAATKAAEAAQVRAELAEKNAEKRIKESELRAHRAIAIKDSGLTALADMVTGNTEAEIAASIEALKQKEEVLKGSGKAAADEETRGAMPGPLSLNQRKAQTVYEGMTAAELARLPKDEYQKARKALMNKARATA